MTRLQMIERKRAAYARRLRSVRGDDKPLSNRRRRALIDILMRADGGISDATLAQLHKLAARGMFDN